MATIDASIPLGVRPAQIESPVNQLAKVLQVQNYQQQGEMNRLTMDEKRRAAEQDRAFNMLYQNAVKPDGTIDRTKLLTGAAQGGFGSKIPGLQEGFAKSDKASTDAEKARLESALKKFEVVGQIMSGVRDQGSWDMARQQTAQMFGPEAAANLPAQYDPAFVEQNRIKAMSVKDQMEQQHKALTFQETKDNNLRVDARTVRGQDMTAQTAAQGQQITMRGQNMSQSTAIRGQNLSDTRARDFNLVQQDANNVKREEKKSIADLTKNSQIASMDTMLGTLDRLSNHPGLSRSVGLMGALPTAPGSQSANFQAELNTFQSQAFIPMVAQLKGMGALSDAEGKKLTAAVGALDPKMGEEAFRTSVTRIIQDMEAARERLAGSRRTAQTNGAGGVSGKVVDFGSLK